MTPTYADVVDATDQYRDWRARRAGYVSAGLDCDAFRRGEREARDRLDAVANAYFRGLLAVAADAPAGNEGGGR